MAKDAVEMWLWDAENNAETIPAASETLPIEQGQILTLIAADTEEYRKANDTRAVKKTLSIPSWLNPDISYQFYCVGANGHVYCVALVQAPRHIV